MPSLVLVVEDEPDHAERLTAVLIGQGHTVLGPAPDCSSALELLWRQTPDIAFVDTHLGSETCSVVLEECDRQMVPVIITTTEPVGLPGGALARSAFSLSRARSSWAPNR